MQRKLLGTGTGNAALRVAAAVLVATIALTLALHSTCPQRLSRTREKSAA